MQKAKELCRPPRDSCSIGETEAIIPLEPLATHTSERIFDIPIVSEEISKAKAASGDEGTVVATLKLKIGNDT